MVLYLIGLGLGVETDITVRGLKAVRSSSKVILEHCCQLWGVDKEKLEAFYGKDIVVADHKAEEADEGSVFATAKGEDVSFLVMGDPLCAPSNHTGLVLRARKLGIEVEVIHNVSMVSAVASCGLQPHKFGQTVSIPPSKDSPEPAGFRNAIAANRANGMHTLCLLRNTVDEPRVEEKAQGEGSDLPSRNTSVSSALQRLLEVKAGEETGSYGLDTQCVGLARPGQPTQQIVVGTISEVLEVEFGESQCFLVICGTTDPEEDQLLEWYRVAGNPVDESRLKQPPIGEGGATAAATDAAEPDAGDPCLFNCTDAHGLIAFKTPRPGWSCSVCLRSIPEGSRAFGCRQCNYDVCAGCGLVPDGSAKVVQVPEPWTCPARHGLSLFTTPNDFFCNICNGTIPGGSRGYGCRQCDHDVCMDCGIAPDGRVKVVEVPGPFNCPALHGLAASPAPNKAKCDLCSESILEGSLTSGCRRCNYDVCNGCSTGQVAVHRGVGAPAGRASERGREGPDAQAAASSSARAQMHRHMMQVQMAQHAMDQAAHTTWMFSNIGSCTCRCPCAKCRRW